MFLKLNQPYLATLAVTDINGNKVSSDTPVVTVKNIQNNTYFNGILWNSQLAELIMSHVESGVYSRRLVFEDTGVYLLTIQSKTHNITKTVTIEVYDNNLFKYEWLIDSEFTIKYTGASDSEDVQAKIFRESDKKYWDGEDWVESASSIEVPLLEENVYAYMFLPDAIGEYSVTVTSGDNELFYMINVTSTSDNSVSPTFIDHASFVGLDGSDSIIVDEKGSPMQNVQVSVYNPDTKELVAKTNTNFNGEWGLMIRPGNYYFMFEKDGYASIGFDRMVI